MNRLAVPRPTVAALLAGVFLGVPVLAGSAVAQSPEPSPGASAPPPAASPAVAGTFDPASVTVRTDPIAAGLETPVYVTADGTGDGCLYIVERAGRVRLVGADGSLREQPFLDISSLVTEGAELGLHAIAFHPQFADNGRFFVHYNDKDGWTQIAEFKGRPCRSANKKPVRLMLREDQPFVNNNGGWIGFGPDGYLYIPLGDGGGVSPGDPLGIGQSKTSRLSKVLRIDVDVRGKTPYRIPRGNPYARKRGSYPRETWAMGLRDPRRASFDRKTGDLWIGDVGQDRYEEVDRIPAGEASLNFGWSDMEGTQCHNLPDCDPAAYTLPVYQYDQVSPHCGIVGGYVYRGSAIPELTGMYLFSDFCSGYIWALDADAVAAGEPAVAYVLLDAPEGFASFGEDDEGELYVVSLDGSVSRIGAERS
jgi:glucose/arabinose dehydrogenase